MNKQTDKQLRDNLAFEKEKKINSIIIVAGILLSLIGLLIFFMFNFLVGAIILLVGLVMLTIGWTVSNLLFKLKMKDFQNSRKRSD